MFVDIGSPDKLFPHQSNTVARYIGIFISQFRIAKIHIDPRSGDREAAKDSGATYANWDAESKKLTITYSTAKTSNEKIQQAIAAAGYDTRDLAANDEAYDKLDECCKYDRKAAAAKAEKKDPAQHH